MDTANFAHFPAKSNASLDRKIILIGLQGRQRAIEILVLS